MSDVNSRGEAEMEEEEEEEETESDGEPGECGKDASAEAPESDFQ
jgi:hypothetical protein